MSLQSNGKRVTVSSLCVKNFAGVQYGETAGTTNVIQRSIKGGFLETGAQSLTGIVSKRPVAYSCTHMQGSGNFPYRSRNESTVQERSNETEHGNGHILSF